MRSLLISFSLLALLAGAAPAPAATIALPHLSLSAAEEESEEVEGEEECEPGEEFEGEDGEVELCDAEGEATPLSPEECLLRTARALVFTSVAREKVRLVVHYTSYAPADVDVRYTLSGGKGSLSLGRAKAHFAKRGVYSETEGLTRSEMDKVRAATRFTVTLDVLATPTVCRRFDVLHLTTRRSVRNQVVWSQSAADRRSAGSIWWPSSDSR